MQSLLCTSYIYDAYTLVVSINMLNFFILIDGDEITIFDSSDVSFAIQTCNRQLKLVLYGMFIAQDIPRSLGLLLHICEKEI